MVSGAGRRPEVDRLRVLAHGGIDAHGRSPGDLDRLGVDLVDGAGVIGALGEGVGHRVERQARRSIDDDRHAGRIRAGPGRAGEADLVEACVGERPSALAEQYRPLSSVLGATPSMVGGMSASSSGSKPAARCSSAPAQGADGSGVAVGPTPRAAADDEPRAATTGSHEASSRGGSGGHAPGRVGRPARRRRWTEGRMVSSRPWTTAGRSANEPGARRPAGPRVRRPPAALLDHQRRRYRGHLWPIGLGRRAGPAGPGPTAVDHLGRPLQPGRWDAFDPARDVGVPGAPPFTRGIHALGYRSRLWTMRMFAGFGAAEDTNARFRQLLDAGQTGLSVAYDMPTLYGYDTDDPEAEGEFGTCGVAVSSLADMEVLLDGLPLDRVSTSMTINSPAAPIWAMYIAAAEAARLPARHPRGHHPERHPQGVRGPEGVPLPARAIDAPGDRHDRVRDARAAALEHDLDQRLPHPRGRLDRRPGARLHHRRRHGLRRGGARRAACASTTSRRGSPSSSTRTATSSRRSPSSGRPGASGTS